MKKRLGNLITMGMVTLMAGCLLGGALSAAADEVTLELWVAGTEEDAHYKAYPAAIEKFEEENPE